MYIHTDNSQCIYHSGQKTIIHKATKSLYMHNEKLTKYAHTPSNTCTNTQTAIICTHLLYKTLVQTCSDSLANLQSVHIRSQNHKTHKSLFSANIHGKVPSINLYHSQQLHTHPHPPTYTQTDTQTQTKSIVRSKHQYVDCLNTYQCWVLFLK